MSREQPTAREGLHDKYKALAHYVDKLEPSAISLMYKEYKSAQTFYPTLGIFFNEFALVYATSSNQNKKQT
jgi:hypothetical protein